LISILTQSRQDHPAKNKKQKKTINCPAHGHQYVNEVLYLANEFLQCLSLFVKVGYIELTFVEGAAIHGLMCLSIEQNNKRGNAQSVTTAY
jgi:hypothetical protein